MSTIGQTLLQLEPIFGCVSDGTGPRILSFCFEAGCTLLAPKYCFYLNSRVIVCSLILEGQLIH